VIRARALSVFRLGPFRLGPFRFGPFRFGPFWFGPFQFGPFRFGPCRPHDGRTTIVINIPITCATSIAQQLWPGHQSSARGRMAGGPPSSMSTASRAQHRSRNSGLDTNRRRGAAWRGDHHCHVNIAIACATSIAQQLWPGHQSSARGRMTGGPPLSSTSPSRAQHRSRNNSGLDTNRRRAAA
jgi:hypothetical protein